MKIDFNINDNVFVKLTDYGRECLKKNYDELLASYPENKKPFPFKLPEEDKNGYSRWQMWSLMQEFGEHISMGFHGIPFETDIKIEVE